MSDTNFKRDHAQHDLVESIGAFTVSFGVIILIGVIFTIIEVVMK